MINPRVKTVKVLTNYQLLLEFRNNEEKVFDMTPYLDKGVYTSLKNESLFKKAHINWGTVVWNDDVDMSLDTLYLESKSINTLVPANTII
jgi:hypothetical protein